jgi:NADH-ubiquinone oxidoreductase chain 2|uniref:NADH-ubiquinone oxidoreductase chain 2 n=1 Tax=Rhodotorula taiwanensis RS1 TaxID=1246992 RepID=R4ZBB9_9BASI|nr:NADH dehydrogenase subunit 2 [Rhodotorula taiwanensis RS1]
MLVITLLTLLIATPLSSSTKFTPEQLHRATAVTFFFAAALSFNAYYVATLGAGVSLYSGLFHVSTVSMAIECFIFVVGGLILLPWASRTSVIHHTNEFGQGYTPGLGAKPSIPEFALILVFTTIGASFLVSSTDLVSLYLAIELQSFAVYILATLYRENESATSAGLKYFLLGALSSALILLGSALVYAYTGLTNLDAISSLISVSTTSDSVTQGVMLGLVIMTAGFLFKIAAAPFHNWAPDVYDGVPTIVTTWLSVMPKISIFVLLLTVSSLTEGLGLTFGDITVNVWQALLLVCSLLSLIIGTVVGLSQVRIKRLLTYSTISHVGFMLLALAVSGQESIDAFLFYLIQYTLTNLNVFLILLAFGYLLVKPWAQKGTGDVEYIKELRNQFSQSPALALSLLICLFSMAGVPPMMGFFAKYAVLYSAIHNGYYFLSIVGILASVVSAGYYLRVVKVLYFEESSQPTGDGVELSSTHCYLIAVLTAAIVLFVLHPSLLLNSTQLMAMSIYGY